MQKEKATLHEWRDLYEIASKFKKLECWEWISDEEIFGVQNPETGEIGYCCVMGMLGELFGLGVYLGDEGLQSYNTNQNMMEDESEASGFENAILQKFLMVSFSDRASLTNQDKSIIKQLGLRFRGKTGWTMFRDYSPGMIAWYLNREQVIYLTLAIEQAIDVILRYQDDDDLLFSEKEGEYLVRIAQKNKTGEYEWQDKWIKPSPYKKPKLETPKIDMNQLNKILNAGYYQSSTWEIDSFFIPTPIAENNDVSPYYPTALLWVDTSTNIILNHYITEEINTDVLFSKTLSLIEDLKHIPKEIVIAKPEYIEIFKPICAVLKIKLNAVDFLVNIENIKNEILKKSINN